MCERSNPPDAVDLLLDAFMESTRQNEVKLAAVHASTSWRVTAALRFLIQFIRASLSRMVACVRGCVPRPVIKTEPVSYPNADTWYDEHVPDVSVIVLNFNKGTMTVECLQALWRHTSGFRYEIIVVDNGSVADEVRIVEALPGRFRLIKLPINRQFGEGNNIGAEMAKGRFLLFLNNDAFVTQGWLVPMLTMLVDGLNVGVVGPKLIFPDGRLQEAGSLITPDGSTWPRGMGAAADDPVYQRACRVHYCSAACVLMRREVFFQILGFDPWWEPAYYEDADLCLKVAQLKLETWYCPQATVIHACSATTGDPRLGFRMNAALDINRDKFLRRWGAYLRLKDSRPAMAVRALPSVRAGLPAGGRIWLDLRSPWVPDEAARYLLQLAEALSVDRQVSMIVETPYSRSRLLTFGRDLGFALEAVGIEVAEERPCDVADVLITLGDDRPSPLSKRGKRHIHVFWPLATTIATSNAVPWCRCDLMVVTSTRERENAEARFRRLELASQPIRVIGPAVTRNRPMERTAGRDILHIGRFAGWDPRPQQMINVFRKMHIEGSPARLALAGVLDADWETRGSFIQMRDNARDLPVTMISDPTNEEKTDLIGGSSVYWLIANDLGEEPVGTAMLEAMAAGVIPIVLDPQGKVPVIDHGRTGLRVASVEELAHATHRVLAEREATWVHALSSAAAETARNSSIEAFTAAWREALLSVSAHNSTR